MDEAYSEVFDAGTGTSNPMCKCGKRARILTAFTLRNFGKRFYTCGTYVVRIFFFFCNFISQPRILFDLGICFFCNFSRNPVCYLTWVFGFLAIFLATQHFFFLSWDIDSLQFFSQPSVLFDLGIRFFWQFSSQPSIFF
jgi:hypothetical protein